MQRGNHRSCCARVDDFKGLRSRRIGSSVDSVMERETILWGTGIELEVRRYQPTNDKQPHPCERSCEGCFALPQIESRAARLQAASRKFRPVK